MGQRKHDITRTASGSRYECHPTMLVVRSRRRQAERARMCAVRFAIVAHLPSSLVHPFCAPWPVDSPLLQGLAFDSTNSGFDVRLTGTNSLEAHSRLVLPAFATQITVSERAPCVPCRALSLGASLTPRYCRSCDRVLVLVLVLVHVLDPTLLAQLSVAVDCSSTACFRWHCTPA